ncbi:MAG: hypothetical protein JXA30_06350 [Deltaproteobacteria bacterium]|nr:hypothetical protein [Deltaproteobacteria bacterium]
MNSDIVNSSTISRRSFLRRLIGGTGLAASFLAIAINGTGEPRQGDSLPKLPTRPFDNRDLERPHAWAG